LKKDVYEVLASNVDKEEIKSGDQDDRLRPVEFLRSQTNMNNYDYLEEKKVREPDIEEDFKLDDNGVAVTPFDMQRLKSSNDKEC
jgi:hypothetical protein